MIVGSKVKYIGTRWSIKPPFYIIERMLKTVADIRNPQNGSLTRVKLYDLKEIL